MILQQFVRDNIPSISDLFSNVYLSYLKDYKNLIITYLENARSATSIINIILKIDSNTIRKIKKVISFPIDGGQMVRTVDIEPLIGNIIISDCIVYNYHDNTQEIDNEKLIPFEIFGY